MLTIFERVPVWHNLEYISDKRFSISFVETCSLKKQKNKQKTGNIYKHMLVCNCQGGDKVQIITWHFAYYEINLNFSKWNYAKTAKMRIKAVEDKEKNTKNFLGERLARP